MTAIATVFAAALLTVTGATGVDPKPEPTAASVPADKAAPAQLDGSKRYCFKDQITGSNMPRKICKTIADWRREGLEFKAR